MFSFANSLVWVICIYHIVQQTSGASFNQPRFSLNATWNPNATTFADISIVGTGPYGMFISTNNTVYVANPTGNQVVMWPGVGNNITKTISGGLNAPLGLFVTENGDVYVDNGKNGRVDKWTSTNSTPAMYVNATCYSLFIDICNNLYCSMRDRQLVLMKSLNNSSTVSVVVAGTGQAGSSSYQLSNPVGIFVDTNLSLYVADYFNNRIQLFRREQLDATTIAGNGASGVSILFYPTGVVLDADGFLFIVDKDNQRILRSEPNGFRCIVGCSEIVGSTSYQLNLPRTLAFDSCGNLFVVDTNNNRIQKFLLTTNSCSETTTSQSMLASTVNNEQSTASQAAVTSTAPTVATSMYSPNSSATVTTASSEIILGTVTVNKLSVTSFHSTTVSSASVDSTISLKQNISSASFFASASCPNQTKIGVTCNTSATACDLFQPCRNGGICHNTNTTHHGYNCSCLSGFNGTNCESNIRPCQPDTCWNTGICNETSSDTFNCTCQPGWTGVHCEAKINYCSTVQCLNNGVCRPLLLNFTCECLGTSYSGRHCEIVAAKIKFYRTFSSLTAIMSIICMISVALFVIGMDVLKYFVGIDPVKDELQKIRRAKADKVKRRPIAIRYIYVNQALPTIVEETGV